MLDIDTENRYAIIIGINDYDTDPLSYCVKDAVAVHEILIQKANFRKENAFLITSDTSQPIRNITGRIEEAIQNVKEKFRPQKDSIFFYFAGHGSSEDGVSNIFLHDSKSSIKNIYERISPLSPKMQFYVIDACESGGKVLSRKSSSIKNKIDDFIESSTGILLLYACQEHEYAIEAPELQHGVMTHYFIEAINTPSLYDKDGILTPGRIQEYVSKQVSSNTNFSQVPVVENRIIGFYPFSQLNNMDSIESKIAPENKILKIKHDINSGLNRCDKESRLSIQKLLLARVENLLNEIENEFKLIGYSITTHQSYKSINLENVENLKSEIFNCGYHVEEGIDDIFHIKKEPIYENNMSAMGAFGFSPFPSRVIKEYRSTEIINTENKFYSSIDKIFISQNIERISFGVGAVFYQAKWGGVILIYFYKIDWNGIIDSIILDIKKQKYTYLITEEFKNRIDNLEFTEYTNLRSKISDWNNSRKKEMTEFAEKCL